MSGHNKWSKIKHKKAASDQRKSIAFSKYLSLISTSAKEDPDPKTNPRLRSLIEDAKKNNVPSSNILKALSKASEKKNLTPFIFELYGTENVAIIVLASTDNSNRTAQELKMITNKNGLKDADPGSVLWNFVKEGREYKPKFIQKVQNKDALLKVVNLFLEHPDVDKVITNSNLWKS